MPEQKPGTPDLLERIISVVEDPLCQDLCRYFAAAGWDVDVNGNQHVHAYAVIRGGVRPGIGPHLAGLDLLEMTAFLADLRIRREG